LLRSREIGWSKGFVGEAEYCPMLKPAILVMPADVVFSCQDDLEIPPQD
jgi:hypothetical protein